jgi:hypothetical protein
MSWTVAAKAADEFAENCALTRGRAILLSPLRLVVARLHSA